MKQRLKTSTKTDNKAKVRTIVDIDAEAELAGDFNAEV